MGNFGQHEFKGQYHDRTIYGQVIKQHLKSYYKATLLS